MRRLAILVTVAAVLFAASTAAASAAGLPVWKITVADPTVAGSSYPLTLAGGDPRAGGTTRLQTMLVALDLRFTNRVVIRGSSFAGDVLESPIFNPLSVSTVDGQHGQYGDWVQRAEFGKQTTDWHTILQPPAVRVLNLAVPASEGLTAVNARGVLEGKVQLDWLDAQLQAAIQQLHVPPSTLALFLAGNILGYGTNPDDCCVMGYHDATGQPANLFEPAPPDAARTTYLFASYLTARTFAGYPGVGISDVNALSHELVEWLNDPYTNNQVPGWESPLAPQYGCSDWFETGDPLVGHSFTVPGNPSANDGGAWHLQDEAFLSWFLHGGGPPDLQPADGELSYAGLLTAPPEGC